MNTKEKANINFYPMIMDALRNGYEPEDIFAMFDEQYDIAQMDYDKYLVQKQQEEERLQYQKKLREDTKTELGSAMVSFMQARGTEVDEATLARIERFIDTIDGADRRYVWIKRG